MTHQDLQPNVASAEPTDVDTRRAGRVSTLVNWVLALLTVPAAIAVALLAVDGLVLATSF